MSRPAPQPTPTNNDAGPGTVRGAPGRVVEVHSQTRRGLVVAAAFVVAAVVAGITRVGTGWWLPLHLFVVGGLLERDLGHHTDARRHLVRRSRTPASSGRRPAMGRCLRRARTRRRPRNRPHMDVRRGWHDGSRRDARARDDAHPDPPAGGHPTVRAGDRDVRGRDSPGAVGMSIGVLLGTGRAGERAVELRDVHLVINVFGLIGLTIAGTLPFFAATQVRSKMSPRATPTAMRLTFAALVAAITVAAIGHLMARPGVVAGGLITYVLGLLATAMMLPIYARSRLRWAGPRLMQLMAGLVWWGAMTVALAVATIREAADRAILQALVIGGFAQILVASLAYLGPVLRGGGHRRLTGGFAITRSWVSLAAGNTAAVAALVGHGPALVAALAIWLIDIAIPRRKTADDDKG